MIQFYNNQINYQGMELQFPYVVVGGGDGSGAGGEGSHNGFFVDNETSGDYGYFNFRAKFLNDFWHCTRQDFYKIWMDDMLLCQNILVSH